MKDASGLVLPFAFAAFVIGFLIWRYFTSVRHEVRQGLQLAPRASVDALTEGSLAKVIGAVRALEGQLLASPLSGRPCVFYEVVVQEYVLLGRIHIWKDRIREAKQVDFDIDDGTGVVRVSARTPMKHVMTPEQEGKTGLFKDATPELETYLARHGTISQTGAFNRNLRYREGIFAPGERLAVLGQVALEIDETRAADENEYRSAPKRKCLLAPEGGHLLASDEERSTAQ